MDAERTIKALEAENKELWRAIKAAERDFLDLEAECATKIKKMRRHSLGQLAKRWIRAGKRKRQGGMDVR